MKLSQVAKRKVVVLRDQQDFFERGPEFWLEWGQSIRYQLRQLCCANMA